MLQRLLSYDDELYGDGTWSREQLETMNDRFVAAMEAAFDAGLESRASASATVKMNGKQRADEIAIELAWRWLRENMDAGVDVAFVEVVAFVNARCPGVDRARIGVEIKRRFISWVSREPGGDEGGLGSVPKRHLRHQSLLGGHQPGRQT
jgi:hypothetical protein